MRVSMLIIQILQREILKLSEFPSNWKLQGSHNLAVFWIGHTTILDCLDGIDFFM